MRNGLTQMTFFEDPTVKKVLMMEALKVGRPLSSIIRELLRNWLVSRGVKVSTKLITMEGEANVGT